MVLISNHKVLLISKKKWPPSLSPFILTTTILVKSFIIFLILNDFLASVEVHLPQIPQTLIYEANYKIHLWIAIT